MANQSKESQSDSERNPAAVPNRRLWFQVGAITGAWFAIGFIDTLITWRACVHKEQFGGATSDPLASALFWVVWVILFGLTVAAGTLAYRSWRKLSKARELLYAEGRERKEFMSQAAVFMSVTLGAGILWYCVPLFLLELCARTR
jgi:hypothetical protein